MPEGRAESPEIKEAVVKRHTFGSTEKIRRRNRKTWTRLANKRRRRLDKERVVIDSPSSVEDTVKTFKMNKKQYNDVQHMVDEIVGADDSRVDLSKLPSANEVRARMAELEKDREDKRTLRGEYAPKSGTCRVCGGGVFANIAYPQSKMIGGPPLQAYVKDWNCEECGIAYKFPPKKKVQVKR